MEVRKAFCSSCDKHLRYTEPVPKKQKGVTMHFGERFCLGGKRARKFSRSDPKIYVPSWCPKRKDPSELRIYGFKSTNDWMMHDMLCCHLERDIHPEARRYAVEHEQPIKLTAREFAQRCNEEPDEAILGVAVQRYQVVEIDDGIEPSFFYKTEQGYELLSLFDAATARKNVKEDKT